MVRDYNIDNTLKKALFDCPSPVSGQVLFQRLKPVMFGDCARFVDFLVENDQQRRVEKAKEILLYIAFSLPYSLPNRFLLNLLSYESHSFGSTNSYVPQDHYVHSVYTYLLGLYTFFYHRGFWNEVSGLFSHIRLTSDDADELHSRRHQNLESAEDFIFSWKLFSIIHDIGYPWECDPDFAETKDMVSKHRKAFFRATKSLEKDCSLRAVSLLAAFYLTLRPDRAATFRMEKKHISHNWHCFSDNKPASIADAITALDDYDDWVLMQPICGNTFAKTMSCVFPQSEVIALLEVRGDDCPKLFVLPIAGKSHIISRTKNIMKVGDHQEICEAAFHSGTTFSSGQVWRYYVKAPRDSFMNFLQITLGDEATNAFILLCDSIVQTFPLNMSMVSTDAEYSELAFYVYKNLIHSFFYDRVESSDACAVDNNTATEYSLKNYVYKRKYKAFTQDIVEVLRKKMDKNIEGKSLSDFDEAPFRDKLLFYFGSWEKVIQIVTYVEKRIAPNVEKELNLEAAKLRVFSAARLVLHDNLPLQVAFTDESSPVLATGLSSSNLAEMVLEFAAAAGLVSKDTGVSPSSLDFFVGYKPDWASKLPDGRFLDHGVASAFLLMEINNAIASMMKGVCKDRQSPQSRFLQLALGTGSQCNESLLMHHLSQVTAQATFSILMHNLYPKFLEEGFKEYKTSLRKQPFLYLAVLMCQ